MLPHVASCPLPAARCPLPVATSLRSFALATTRVSPHLLNLKAYAPKCRASRAEESQAGRLGVRHQPTPAPAAAPHPAPTLPRSALLCAVLCAASSTALFMGCLSSLNKSSCSCFALAATLPSLQLDLVGIRTRLSGIRQTAFFYLAVFLAEFGYTLASLPSKAVLADLSRLDA